MPGFPLYPIKGQRESQILGAGVLFPVGGWDKRVVPVLYHAQREPGSERLRCRVEVA